MLTLRVLKMNDYERFFKNDPWSEIAEPSYPEGRQLYMNDDRFWVSKNQNNQIQFFVHEREKIDIKSIENLAGVEISINAFNQKSSRLICTLTSHDSAEMSKFSIVAKDVAYHCSNYSGLQLFLKVQERIKSWANFLKPTRAGLSHSELVGFWGELYTVSEFLMKTHSPSDAVRFWVGPEGKKQDITLNSLAIEIKTSTSGDPRTIKISSLEQLEKVTDKLYLLHIVITPSTSEGDFSLETLYRKCTKLISHNIDTETQFSLKTSELYGKASEVQLQEKFSISSFSLFDVADDFPSITRSEINQGVSKVQYEIYISALNKFEETRRIEEVLKNG